MRPLILASASPRRRELLTRIGVPLEVLPAETDEQVLAGESAQVYAARVAADKARTVAEQHPERWVLGADTVVEIDGEILGKAPDSSAARGMLERLAGRTHRVTTAFALYGGGQPVRRSVTTEVSMRALQPAELADYLVCGEWQGKAGAYAVQGIAAAFVVGLRGSITNVIGLPLAEVVEALVEAGAPGPQYHQGVPA